MKRLTATLTLLLGLLVLPLVAAAGSTGSTGSPGPADPTVPIITVAPFDASPTEVSIGFSQLAIPDGGADEVLISRNDLFPDALASGFLQGRTTPLLLTEPTTLSPAVAAEIERLGATSAIVLGGENAVAAAVVDQLESRDLDVRRVAGPARVETAVAVSEAVDSTSDTAVLARAYPRDDPTQAFADALGAGALAASEGWPILLTQSDTLSASTSAALAGGRYDRIVVVGGEAAIASEVVADLPTSAVTDRIAGQTRFDTAARIAVERGFTGPQDADTIVVLDGQADDAWAAGFSAAAYAAREGAPVLLANGDALPPATQDWLARDSSTDTSTPRQGQPTVVCAARPDACTAAAELLFEPALRFAQAAPGVVVHHHTPVVAEVRGPADQISVVGPCLADSSTTINPGNMVTRRIAGVGDPEPAPDGPCDLEWSVSRPDGTIESGQTTVLVDVVDVTFPALDAVVGGSFDVAVADPDAQLRIGSFCFDGIELSPDLDDDGTVAVPVTPDALDVELVCPGEYELTFADGGHQLGSFVPTLRCPGGQVSTVDGAAGAVRVVHDGVVTSVLLDDVTTHIVDGQRVNAETLRTQVSAGDCLEVVGSTARLHNARYLCFPADLPRVFELSYSATEGAGAYTATIAGTPATTTFEDSDQFSLFGQAVDVEEFIERWQPGDCIDTRQLEAPLIGFVHDLRTRLVEIKAFRF